MPTLCLTKGRKTGGGSQVDGHWETPQEWSTLQEEQEFSVGTL